MLLSRERYSETLKLIAKQILLVLVYLHRRLVVHGDIKPENILLAEGDRVKLADFGHSSVTGCDHFSVNISGGPSTVAYTAPEVLVGGKPTAQSDIWSFCCTLLYLFTGTRPWPHLSNDWAIICSIGTGKDSPDLPDIGKQNHLALDAIKWGLARNPDDRPSANGLFCHEFFKRTYS